MIIIRIIEYEEQKLNQIILRLGREFIPVGLSEIDFIQSEGKYIRIYKGNQSFLKKQSLQGFAEKFAEQGFVRISRYSVINILKMVKIEWTENRGYNIRLKNGRTLPWGSKYKKNLLNKFYL